MYSRWSFANYRLYRGRRAAPLGRKFKVRMDKVSGPKVKAWWFNPRNGEATALGEFPSTGEREFTPPDYGEMLDWVLVLDDASKNYPPPGKKVAQALQRRTSA